MKALRAVWGDTRMIVLTAISAALYAALLIPFKIIPLLPGTTEIRPANAIPIVTSLLFGPAGAWGSALGNLVGDFFGGLGPGNLFGLVGNFLFGFVPYAFWRLFFGDAVPEAGNRKHLAVIVLIAVVASSACALPIAWGIEFVIGGYPFALLGSLIFLNNFLMTVILAPPLLFALLPRVKAWGLLYTQILPAEVTRAPRTAWLGALVMTVASVAGLGGGVLLATRSYGQSVRFIEIVKEVRYDEAKSHPAGSATASVTSQAPAKLATAPAPSATTPAVAAPARAPSSPVLGRMILPFVLACVLAVFLL